MPAQCTSYYYDSENISESLLAFRKQVSIDHHDFGSAQDDYSAIEKVFGFDNGNPRMQEIGEIVTEVSEPRTQCLTYLPC